MTWLTSITSFNRELQSSVNTVHPGLFKLKALAAGSSFSMAQQDSATPASWRPSDRPGTNTDADNKPFGNTPTDSNSFAKFSLTATAGKNIKTPQFSDCFIRCTIKIFLWALIICFSRSLPFSFTFPLAFTLKINLQDKRVEMSFTQSCYVHNWIFNNCTDGNVTKLR